MGNRCSNGRCSFAIEHRADSAKVADMYAARAGKLSDVIRETKVKNYTYVADRRVYGECVGRSRVNVVIHYSTQANAASNPVKCMNGCWSGVIFLSVQG